MEVPKQDVRKRPAGLVVTNIGFKHVAEKAEGCRHLAVFRLRSSRKMGLGCNYRCRRFGIIAPHTPLYREIGGLEDKGFGHEINRADRVDEFAITGCIQGV